ncbi:MAG: alpha/beta hydrolase [Microthrixaceae bacterium]|nr:alpha/beta hydrolase [Microthrixaceae bacterium]MCO5318475.1 alpha/beta hydrolase [Microthrixaceae bacterium]
MSQVLDPIEGPLLDEPVLRGDVEVPHLARHEFQLDDGHTVGVAVAGEGVPLVVVHGFSAEGFLYAQSLSRLVRMGFRVVAIDTAGHGATQGLPLTGHNINDYADLLGRAIDELGIERFVLAGHSMGGQLIARLGSRWPERTLGVVFIDAIVGDTWDRMVYLFRVNPPLLAAIGLLLLVDSVSIAPTFSDPRQAMKLMRLVLPTLRGHATHPWRLLGPMMSILRTRSSRYALDELHRHSVPVVAIHGSYDLAVPHRTSVDTARRTEGTLVTVQRGGHSWLLKDPESLPAIMSEMLAGPLGEGIRDGIRAAGVRRRSPTLADVERVCYREGAAVFDLAPRDRSRRVLGRHRSPKYRWSVERPRLEKLS